MYLNSRSPHIPLHIISSTSIPQKNSRNASPSGHLRSSSLRRRLSVDSNGWSPLINSISLLWQLNQNNNDSRRGCLPSIAPRSFEHSRPGSFGDYRAPARCELVFASVQGRSTGMSHVYPLPRIGSNPRLRLATGPPTLSVLVGSGP
jgi:hypothetical protein